MEWKVYGKCNTSREEDIHLEYGHRVSDFNFHIFFHPTSIPNYDLIYPINTKFIQKATKKNVFFDSPSLRINM